MSRQVAQLLVKTNESNSALEARTRTLEKYLTIAKGKSSSHPRDPTRDPNNEEIDSHSERPTSWSNNHVDEESTNGQPNIDHESDTKHALSKARIELSAKTATLEQLYTDQAPEDHLNQAATAARNTCMEYDENTRSDERQENPHKSIRYTPFDGIENNDTDSETTVWNHWEESVPFQHLDDRDILDMSNNEGNNPLVRMVKYMLDQNINTTMEKSPLAKAGVKVTPPYKYSGEQSFEALETFVLLLGTRLEGKALEWFDKTVKPRKYQGTPMGLEQVMTGLYGQYISSLARHKASNRFDLIKQGMLSVQEFTTELKLYVSQMVQRPETYSLCKKDIQGSLDHLPIIGSGRITNRPIIALNTIILANQATSSPTAQSPCPEPLRARRIGAVHVEDSPEGQVDNADLDINDNIDDEHLDEDEYCNNEYDNQLDLSEDQRSWGSKPIRYSHDLARIAAVVLIGLANARKAKIAEEGEPLYDHMVKMKTDRPARSKHNLLTITGYFLVGGTKAHCPFNSSCEDIIMSSGFARATGLHMHKLPEPIGIQQAFQGSRVKLYYTVTTDITITVLYTLYHTRLTELWYIE
ncbi:hypothetical protein M422DRAFT_251826 [Sphaerobolus stellatus SS14]|uniref:Retrotransposon gag domain-containing protein n=1 Tax=Sphaerobolus stellatus (strain SS14) TaxID=990650 RepID=A0A0C9VR34_SPHS4|nr:hypothetical protein M422DRAFT_251826 [Sphaerobolus stellatus SS14]